MAKIIETEVFTFDELSESAKERARQWYREGELDYDWWDSIYEDAENIGLKITGFDLDRHRSCEGKLLISCGECCARIIAEHGETCDTYKLAKQFYADRRNGEHSEGSEDEFKRALLEEYSLMLQNEYEYLLSDESVDESIRANEYTFTKTGKRFG